MLTRSSARELEVDMDERQVACEGESCAGTPGEAHVGGEPVQGQATLTIDIVSDVICPWCFIGKRRLQRALALLDDSAAVRVIWRPFQLNPRMPPQGMDRRAYRVAKFGSWENSVALDAKVAEAGRGEGIAFACWPAPRFSPRKPATRSSASRGCRRSS
jgi:hypothetical protein